MPLLRWLLAVLLLAALWLSLGLPALGFLICLVPRREPPPAARLPISEDAGVRRCGSSERRWVGDDAGGVWHLRCAGDPATVGWAQGALAGDLTVRLEGEMMETFTSLVPGFLARHAILGLVGLNGRTLPRFYHEDELSEIAASVAGCEATWPTWRSSVPHPTRAIQYHALHDISHYLIDNPLVRVPQIGCTAVAVRGPRAAGGGLLVGRLFDFEGGREFDVSKLVRSVRPAQGLAWLSIGWAGLAGAVTGMNEAGLWVSINAGESSGQGSVGRPIILVAREILQSCRTIRQAEAILRAAPVFVSEAVLLASGPEARAVVVELGPSGCDVRAMEDDRLVVTNHFLAPRWSDDPANRRRLAEGTSPRRYARAMELLDATPEQTPTTLLEVLRDRRAVGGQEVGFGNRGTINAWIGAHLVVADLSRQVVWVCEAPHGLGRAWAFGLDGPLAESPLPASGDRERCVHFAGPWARALRDARRLHAAGDHAGAARAAAEAAVLNPDHFESQEVLALTATDPAQRASAAQRALALQPAYPADRQRSERLLAGTP